MLFPSLVPSNVFPIGIIGWSLPLMMAAPMIYLSERSQPMHYSKFASIKENELKFPLSSKLGMLIIYLPALLASTACLCSIFESSMPVKTLMFVHFLKRTLEVLFLHNYSGKMETMNAISIGFMYTVYSCLILSTADPVVENNCMWMIFGYITFTIGLVGNFYHHVLLTRLRRTNASIDITSTDLKMRYQAPIGGGFSFVASPHYSFELLIWFGIACVSQSIVAFMVVSCMTSYLLARGKNTNDFYHSRFDQAQWPDTRKALIPFLI
jgi:3-oxo-5-alpha-steroid 4-dehydrogenase